jgi:deoxyribodipyrimidine photo-lyase
MGVQVVWFRRDLRIHDHEPLRAAAKAGPVLPVWARPANLDQPSLVAGFARTSPLREKFLAESLLCLDQKIERMGGALALFHCPPARALAQLAEDHEIEAIHYTRLAGTEEAHEASEIERWADAKGIAVRSYEGVSMVPPSELPFSVEQTPGTFTTFRKKVEQRSAIPKPLQAPETIQFAKNHRYDGPPIIPDVSPDPRRALALEGGETAALARLKHYFWQEDHLARYKSTRNGMLGEDYSSKLSPWLAHGCLSPRVVWHQIKKYEEKRTSNKSTYWLGFELLWRDFFYYTALKEGADLFKRNGIQQVDLPWSQDESLLNAWREGRTGYPIVDANMVELKETGFMSNRGRQIVASFLTKTMGIDWRVGAEWFEHHLIDYDPASNWGNWQYQSGVGNDARSYRLFNPEIQAEKYDEKAEYVKHWLPELEPLSPDRAHKPWSQDQVEYPEPIVDYKQASRERKEAIKTRLARAPAPAEAR